MNTRLAMTITAVLAISAHAFAGQIAVREFSFQALEHPDTHVQEAEGPRRLPAAADSLRAETNALAALKLYPMAGSLNRDFFIPYYVDLDERSGSKLDFRCGDYSFDGHTGHDAYIRSFREQEIGVPIFAPLDATVLDVRDGEPDQNTSADPNARSNYVILSHISGYRTEYMHLKRDSITVRPGDVITAGTQIGLVGSSGPSAAPHLHWETRISNVPVEPLAGPCRAGNSMFERQPDASNEPVVIGLALSDVSFSSFPRAPHDNAPRQATFLKNSQNVNLRIEIANVRAGSTYSLTVTQPNGTSLAPATGVLTAYTAYLASASWALDVPLTQSGTWMLTLRVNGARVAEVPFRVVDSAGEIVNRAPVTPTVSIEPVALRHGEVAVCRAETGLLADPDTDVVQYRYEWRVNGNVVREFTSAARTDALARQHVVERNSISCSVTVSDGRLSAPAVTANSDVGGVPRRRAAGR